MGEQTGVSQQISHYRVLDSLGQGGMGVVYKAEDVHLGRSVALKFLPNEFAKDPRTRARFHREARAASALNHPNICTIYEIGEDNDRAFIAMEYLEGASLRQLMAKGPIEFDQLLDIAIAVTSGLEEAHTKGIVHRDIKPGNILVTNSGLVKILDFGLAKLMPSAVSAPDDETGASLVEEFTSTAGTVLGTVQYMSPEQVMGQAVDARSDLFSFGVMLYELATGSLPFRGESGVAVLVSIVHAPPTPPRRLRPEMPEELDRIISKCLEKKCEQRYQGAAEIRADLNRLKRDSGSEKLLPAPRQRRTPAAGGNRVLIMAGAGVLVTAAVIGMLIYRTTRKPTAVAQAGGVAAPLTVLPITSFPGRKLRPIFSSDGNAVAFAWDGGVDGQNSDVYLMQLGGGTPLQLTRHSASEWPQVFSPDGRRLYFTRQSESNFASYWIPALGGDETRVAEGIVTDISPDRRSAALVRPSGSPGGQGVFVLDLSTGAERKLAKDYGAMNPKFSADGQWLFVQDGPDRDHLRLHRVAVSGGKVEPVSFGDLGSDVDRIESIEMAPRRTRMLIGARAKSTNALLSFIANADGSEPTRLPAGVPIGALSPDGHQMMSVRNSFGVKMYRVDAFPMRGRPVIPQRVLDTPNEEYSPKFSPDGSHVLMSCFRKQRWEIWLWSADFADGRPLFAREGGTAGSPAWSADGKWIAFDARTRNSGGDIWLMTPGGEPKMIVDHPEDDITPCFDPANQWIYFTSSRTGALEIFRVPVSGGPATQITKSGGFTCQFSADGRYIYYLKTRNGGEIWRLDAASNHEEPIVPEMKSRNWKVLSDGIYMLDSDTNSQLGTASRAANARFYRFATKSIQDLGFRTPRAATFLGIDISPDGKWLYYSQVDSAQSELFLTENLP